MFLFAVPSVWRRRKEKIGGETGDGMEATNYERGRQLVPPKSRFSSLPLPPNNLLPSPWAQRAKDPIFSLRPRPNERASEEGGMIHSPRPANLSSYMH